MSKERQPCGNCGTPVFPWEGHSPCNPHVTPAAPPAPKEPEQEGTVAAETDDASVRASKANIGDVTQALQLLAVLQGISGQGDNVLSQVTQVLGQIEAFKGAFEAQLAELRQGWGEAIEQNGKIFAELQRIKRELVKLSKPPTKIAAEGSKILGASGDWVEPDAGGEIIRDDE